MINPHKHNSLYEFGAYRFDARNDLLWHHDELISLKPKPIALLKLLLQQPNEAVTKQQIMDSLWPDTIVEEANLTQTVHLLRKALSHEGGSQTLIETVPKNGYRWIGELRQATLAQPASPVADELVSTASPSATVTSAEPAQRQAAQVEPNPVAAVPSVHSPRPMMRPTMRQWNWWSQRHTGLVTAGILLALAVAVFSSTLFARRDRGVLVDSLAVLPFGSVGTETGDPSLSLGLADTLITRLGTNGKFDVRPTAAIARYTDIQIDALKVGKQLGVEAVLTGYIHRTGGQMRLTAQLVRVSDGKSLWSEAFDGRVTDLFMLEDRLSEQVSTALRLPPNAQIAKSTSSNGTANLEAWQLYQKGRYFWNKRQWTSTKKAIEMFEQALQLDPNYAQAYAGLADSYALWNPEMTPRERLAKAKPAAEKALALNETLAEAHASLGFIKYKFEWDWRGAEEQFKRALVLNPSYATAHHWYGESLSLNGRHQEALTRLQEAERLNPLAFSIKEDIGLAHYRARDFANAERKLREVLDMDPNFHRTHHKLADILQEQGRYAEAFQAELAFWRGNQIAAPALAGLQQAFQQNEPRLGWQACAHKELELLIAGQLVDDAHRRARLSVRIGDHKGALKYLQQSFAERGEGPLRLNEPEFDPLRGDPQFQQLLQQAGHLM